MNYYIDICIKTDSNMRLNVLLNAVYTNLHKILHDLAATNIGISFPRYNVTLGNILRIHAEKTVLSTLQGFNWIGDMSDHCNVSDIYPVPENIKFRIISRKQPTMSQSKLKRLIKRGSILENDVKQYKAKMFSKGLHNPYLELVSGSTRQKHRRYIGFSELLDHPVPGEFDQFGLSKTATIPWFD